MALVRFLNRFCQQLICGLCTCVCMNIINVWPGRAALCAAEAGLRLQLLPAVLGAAVQLQAWTGSSAGMDRV